MSDGCIFCAIVAGDIPSQAVHEDDRTLAFMDINPATEGHLLVIPKAHATDIWDLTPEDGIAVWRTVQRMAGVVREALQPPGLTLFQANARAGWQDVFHFHMHLVPRYADDGLARPWKAVPATPESISVVADRLRAVVRGSAE